MQSYQKPENTTSSKLLVRTQKRSLKELREGMDDFLRALNEIGKEVEEDFEKILFSFDVAEKEFNKISGISRGLREIEKYIYNRKRY